MNKKIFIVMIISFFFSGCALINGVKKIITPYHPSSQAKVVEISEKKHQKVVQIKQIAREKEISKIKSQVQTKKKFQKKDKATKFYKKIHKKIAKKRLKEEPFSIKSKEKDPELLGPQTTWKNNPLTKKEELIKKG